MDTATKAMDAGPLAHAKEATPETCPLCQKSFDPACGSCSPACPLSRGCNALTCPHCGYSFPKPTGLSSWLARFFASRRARSKAAGPATLADVGAGGRVRVTGFSRDGGERLSKLAAFGIVEGCELRVRQTYPAFIVEVGETTLAFDSEVARDVHVAAVAG